MSQKPELEKLRAHLSAVTHPPEGTVYVNGPHISKVIYEDVRSAIGKLEEIVKGSSAQDKNDASEIIEFLKGDDVLSMPLHLRPDISQMSSDVAELYERIITADDTKFQRFRVMKDYFLSQVNPERKPMEQVLGELIEAGQKKTSIKAGFVPN